MGPSLRLGISEKRSQNQKLDIVLLQQMPE
jgi:hypothetical protein